MLGGVVLAIFAKQTRPLAVTLGMLGSLAGMIAVSQFTWTTEVAGQVVEHKIFWPWFTLIGTTLTLLIAAAVNFLAPRRSPSADSPR
jgi:MFS superfamily sulfate permease-like transporter